jgi:hypothetical protein
LKSSLFCNFAESKSAQHKEQMSPKRVYYKPSKEVGYGHGQPTNGAALHQVRLLSLNEHCERLEDDDACCSAAEVLKKMRTDEFWSMPVTASKSIEVPKSTRAFQAVGVIECARAGVAAVVRLVPDAQPGDVRKWLVKHLNFCRGCATHKVDVFRLDELETAAAIAATYSADVTAVAPNAQADTPLAVRKVSKKGARYANQHKVWELHLRCLLDDPGAFTEQKLLKDLSGGGGSRLISNTITADMTFPDAADESMRQQLVHHNINAILDSCPQCAQVRDQCWSAPYNAGATLMFARREKPTSTDCSEHPRMGPSWHVCWSV